MVNWFVQCSEHLVKSSLLELHHVTSPHGFVWRHLKGFALSNKRLHRKAKARMYITNPMFAGVSQAPSSQIPLSSHFCHHVSHVWCKSHGPMKIDHYSPYCSHYNPYIYIYISLLMLNSMIPPSQYPNLTTSQGEEAWRGRAPALGGDLRRSRALGASAGRGGGCSELGGEVWAVWAILAPQVGYCWFIHLEKHLKSRVISIIVS